MYLPSENFQKFYQNQKNIFLTQKLFYEITLFLILHFSHSNVPNANEYAGIVWNSFFIFEITNTIFKRSVLHQPLSVNKKELFKIFVSVSFFAWCGSI